MLYAEKQTFPVSRGDALVVESDEPFNVYGLKEGEPTVILGPGYSTARRCTFNIPEGITEIEISTPEGGFYTVGQKLFSDTKENVDPVPKDVGIQQPLTLKEEMQRFVRTELSSQMQAKGFGSFEEEDDFKAEDEDEEQLSPYEYKELQDEYVPEERPGDGRPGTGEPGEDDPPDEPGDDPPTDPRLEEPPEKRPDGPSAKEQIEALNAQIRALKGEK